MYWASAALKLPRGLGRLRHFTAGQTPARLPLRTTRDPFYTLKSVHLSLYERDGVVPWLRAANHGLLYVCERPAGGTRTDLQGE